ncbi:FHA domain-containing protein [Actinoplanes sp. LDG1-06]|uniref:FHA domain-containing protein n=1 Tax=Paractinoplanes ovalisporus TaxID=2810368 RepID=A0ABS2AN17_9ACTN|nr:FHA domain-containing protein [Actinoplanes ovalisporus]MBM2621181.1 FHA domain-containing protein [Actinoplanes ovalisporus]
MRFEVSKVLDAIEARLTTDPALARAVVDMSEIIRYADLDGGRPASSVRLGLVIDALGKRVSEENVPVYVVAPRGLLSDTDLTSNERMVIRRWADDGKVEVVPQLDDRVFEVAELLGLPVLTRTRGNRDRHPWVEEPGRLLAAVAGEGGSTVLMARVGRGEPPRQAERSPIGERLLARVWSCPEPNCTSFGSGGDPDSPFADMRTYTSPVNQPPPALRSGVPTCPRHGAQLRDAGPRPSVEVLSVRIDGVIRRRFVVSTEEPTVVGRAPEGGRGVMLGQWLTDDARKWISRGHVQFTLRTDGNLTVQDISTNGSGVRLGGSTNDDERIALHRQESRTLGPNDVVELYAGVQVGRSKMWATGGVVQPESVMAEAPTMALRKFERS